MAEAEQTALAEQRTPAPSGGLVLPGGYDPIEPAQDPDNPQTEPAEPKDVLTAFLVILEANGDITVTADVTTDIVLERLPSFDDIHAAMSVLSAGWSPTEKDDSGKRLAETCFLVMIEAEGRRWATSEVNIPLHIKRHPVATDVAMAAATVIRDISAMQIVQQASVATLNLMMQAGNQIAQVQENERIARNLGLQGKTPPQMHRR